MPDETVMLPPHNAAGTGIRRLGCDDVVALQVFNRELGADRARFNPHPYDTQTLKKLMTRSEKGDDLALGLFERLNDRARRRNLSESDPGDRDGLERRIGGYFFLWYFRERVPLLGIGLLPEHQGKGLGERIVRFLLEQAALAGCEGVELTTLPDNHRAFALYKKCGFKYYGDVDNHSGDGRIITERAMFHALKAGARPMEKKHGPPVGPPDLSVSSQGPGGVYNQ